MSITDKPKYSTRKYSQRKKKTKLGPQSNLFLVGLPGSGKTTIGWALAKQVGYGFIDLDDWIYCRNGHYPGEIIKSKGEQAFRRIETSALGELIGIRNHIIALGGGSLNNQQNKEIISQLGISLWVDTQPEIIAARLMRCNLELRKRPLLSEGLADGMMDISHSVLKDYLGKLMLERKNDYKSARLVFSNAFLPPRECALQIRNMIVRSYLCKYFRF